MVLRERRCLTHLLVSSCLVLCSLISSRVSTLHLFGLLLLLLLLLLLR
jgi:hypothetical protein